MSTEALPAQPLPRTPASQQGVDARGISAFLAALEAAPGIEMHSLQVLRHGAVVAEGWWNPYSAERPHLLYSLSKSFTATALGFAVAEGLVDLDASVLSYFPELDGDVTDERSRRILVRHVAAMASGHRDETLGAAASDPTGELVRGFLRLPPEEEPGSFFAYNQPCTYSIAAIVQRRTGSTLTQYLRPRLFDPLGIGEVAWTADATGRELGFSGLHAPTEAVARLGQLYLQRGEWNGRQVLSPEWVAEATRVHVANPDRADPDWQQGYCLQFWRSRHGYRGDGAYGQFCLVLPEQDAVVAITCQTPDMQGVLDAVWAHLLPALSDPQLGDDVGAGEDALALELAGLALPPLPDDGSAAPQGVFRAATGSEPESLTEVRFEGDEVVLFDSGAELRAVVGRSGWIGTGALTVSGGVSGSVTGFSVDVVFVETPHRLHLTFIAGTDEFSGRWETAPLGAPALRELRMPRA
ncbi:MAG: serine hydrolase domain-containing protein [Janthinobacterium lividum]